MRALYKITICVSIEVDGKNLSPGVRACVHVRIIRDLHNWGRRNSSNPRPQRVWWPFTRIRACARLWSEYYSTAVLYYVIMRYYTRTSTASKIVFDGYQAQNRSDRHYLYLFVIFLLFFIIRSIVSQCRIL